MWREREADDHDEMASPPTGIWCEDPSRSRNEGGEMLQLWLAFLPSQPMQRLTQFNSINL